MTVIHILKVISNNRKGIAAYQLSMEIEKEYQERKAILISQYEQQLQQYRDFVEHCKSSHALPDICCPGISQH